MNWEDYLSRASVLIDKHLGRNAQTADIIALARAMADADAQRWMREEIRYATEQICNSLEAAK